MSAREEMFDFLKIKKTPALRIVHNGHPALRAKSMPVISIDDDLRKFAESMIYAMKHNEVQGVGLAAPQVGVNRRLIVIDTRPTSKERTGVLSPGEVLLNPMMPMALVNPEILSSSAEKETCGEGCLSLPGVEGEVTRPARVTLRSKLLDGREILVECGGLLARCLQHEIDHLDGILFYDRISPEEKRIADPVMAELAQVEAKMIALEKRAKRQ